MRISVDDIKGIVGIIPSPATHDAADFRAKNTVNLEQTAKLVRILVDTGIDVIMTTGTFGECATIAGDQEIEWSSRDAFVIPNWTWHRHINHSGSGAAILFSVTDRVLLRALGLYREEPENSFRAMPLAMGANGISE